MEFSDYAVRVGGARVVAALASLGAFTGGVKGHVVVLQYPDGRTAAARVLELVDQEMPTQMLMRFEDGGEMENRQRAVAFILDHLGYGSLTND